MSERIQHGQSNVGNQADFTIVFHTNVQNSKREDKVLSDQRRNENCAYRLQ